MPADDDWRLRGQERYLQGATLVRKRYRTYSDTWEHDHCAFCWAKFMDPELSAEHRKQVAGHPEILTEGYATTDAHPRGSDYHWICEGCFEDFKDRFEWTVEPN